MYVLIGLQLLLSLFMNIYTLFYLHVYYLWYRYNHSYVHINYFNNISELNNLIYNFINQNST